MVRGLFEKLHGLVPGSRESRRLYAGEVAVVVIGVLLALGADQAVRYVSDRIETAEARERIVGEVNRLTALAVERIALDSCIRSQIDVLHRGLAEGRDDWSDAVFNSSTKQKRALREMYHTPDRPWSTYAYDEAINVGSLKSATAHERWLLSTMYVQFEEMRQLNQQEVQLSTQLAVLQSNPALSPEERHRLMTTLAELDLINASMVLQASQQLNAYHQLGDAYRTPPEFLADAKQAIGDIRKGNREIYGTCADIDAYFRIDPRYR